jgi:hypothetical protein
VNIAAGSDSWPDDVQSQTWVRSRRRTASYGLQWHHAILSTQLSPHTVRSHKFVQWCNSELCPGNRAFKRLHQLTFTIRNVFQFCNIFYPSSIPGTIVLCTIMQIVVGITIRQVKDDAIPVLRTFTERLKFPRIVLLQFRLRRASFGSATLLRGSSTRSGS